jgi:hypothetical protein
MRHSTIKLTIDTYGLMLPGAQAEAVCGLAKFFSSPGAESNVLTRTGTDDVPIDKGAVYAQCATQVSRKLHANDTHETAEILSPAGLEPTTYGLKVPKNYGRKSTFEKAQCAPDLAQLIAAWPSFSTATRRAIQAVVDAVIE